MSPYWHGFGQPPEFTFRADFDDVEYNRQLQARRALIKGRFFGGNLGWIVPEDRPLFAALYRKPITGFMDDVQQTVMTLIERLGPLNIQQIKGKTGYLVKVITPELHRLQEAFLLYEDQYDGEWDRAWYRFEEMFPDCDLNRYTRAEALEIVLQRCACRMVWFDTKAAKSFYRLPEKEIKAACTSLEQRGVLTALHGGLIRTEDIPVLDALPDDAPLPPVRAFYRNDFLVRALDHELKARFKPLYDALLYDHDPQYYVLVEGEFRALSVGHFRYGPYETHDTSVQNPQQKEISRMITFANKKYRSMEELRITRRAYNSDCSLWRDIHGRREVHYYESSPCFDIFYLDEQIGRRPIC